MNLSRYSVGLDERPHDAAIFHEGAWVVFVRSLDELMSAVEPGESLVIHEFDWQNEEMDAEIYDPENELTGAVI